MNFKKKLIPTLLASTFVSATFSVPALANDSTELENLRALVQELDQKIKVLDRKNELADEAAAAKKKETPIVKASEKGFGIQSADGQHEFKLRGLIQADGRVFDGGKNLDTKAAPGGTNAGYLTNTQDAYGTALLRRVRPTFEGTVFGNYGFRFTPEFGDGKSSVVDAYLDAKLAPAFNIRAGKYKPFVGLERLQSGADIKFIERSYVSNVLPNRDLGVSIYGDVLNNKLSYAVGFHNGVVDGGDTTTSSDLNNSKDFAARVFASPFKDSDSPLAGLSFGLGATYGDVKGTTKDTVSGSTTELTTGYKSEGQQTFFRYIDGGVLRSGIETTTPFKDAFSGPGSSWLAHADGQRLRVSPQASYYNGPFGLIGEYVLESQEVSVGSGNYRKTRLNNDAWEIGGSWLITGEDASFKGVKPKNNFDLNKGTWGAWELVARYSEQSIDDDAFQFGSLTGGNSDTINGLTTSSSVDTTLLTKNHWLYADPKASAKSAKTWTAGINWYLNPEVKFAINYSQTSFEGGGGSLLSSNTASNPGWYDLVTKGTVRDREDERVLLARFQIAY